MIVTQWCGSLIVAKKKTTIKKYEKITHTHTLYTLWRKERIWSIFRFFNRFCFSKQQTKGAATPIILRNCVSTFTPTNYPKSTALLGKVKGRNNRC